MKNYDLKILKKRYGEKFARLCRSLFPTLLEEKGVLSEIITEKFADNKFLYDDIIELKKEDDFKDFVYNFVNRKNTKKNELVTENPHELMKKAGYTLYECKTNEEIRSFAKYFEKDEKICTFKDSVRLVNYHVFFAVKDNVDEIKREDFDHPLRQDDYGTSVISLQFKRGSSNTYFITNRYNHAVRNPDATFSNDLENIKAGLTTSFEQEYGFITESASSVFDMPYYVWAADGKMYKENQHINGYHYCIDNVVIDRDRNAKQYNKDRFILLDYYLLDLKKREITFLQDSLNKDEFADVLGDVQKIRVQKNGNNKDIIISAKNHEDVVIGLDKFNNINKYINPNLKTIGDDFLAFNRAITELKLDNVEEIGDAFIANNRAIPEAELPNVTKIGTNFLVYNNGIKSFSAPKLKEVKNNFLKQNKTLESIYAPNLEKTGKGFCTYNEQMKEINFPKLKEVGGSFFSYPEIETAMLDSLKKAGDFFMGRNRALSKLHAPNLEKAGDYFLESNRELTGVDLPNLKETGKQFLSENKKISNANLPSLEHVGEKFLFENNSLESLSLKSLKEANNYFVTRNNTIKELDAPNLKKVGSSFMSSNTVLSKLNSPIEEIGSLRNINYRSYFLSSHEKCEEILEKLEAASSNKKTFTRTGVRSIAR